MRINLRSMVALSLVMFSAEALCAPHARAAEPKARPTAKEPRSAAVGMSVTDDERNAEVRAKLAKRTNMEFIETPLNQVLDFLRDAAEVQIHVKTRALDDAGIPTDVPMTYNLKDVSVETGLELMLDDLRLDFVIDRGLVIVSTPDDLQARLVVRAYHLDPLLADLAPEQVEREAGRLAGLLAVQVAPESWGVVDVGPSQSGVGAAAPGMMGGMPGMGAPGAPLPAGSGMPGGMPAGVRHDGPGAISVFHRLLMVRNSIKVQDQVDQFLRMLAEAKAVAK